MPILFVLISFSSFTKCARCHLSQKQLVSIIGSLTEASPRRTPFTTWLRIDGIQANTAIYHFYIYKEKSTLFSLNRPPHLITTPSLTHMAGKSEILTCSSII